MEPSETVVGAMAPLRRESASLFGFSKAKEKSVVVSILNPSPCASRETVASTVNAWSAEKQVATC